VEVVQSEQEFATCDGDVRFAEGAGCQLQSLVKPPQLLCFLVVSYQIRSGTATEIFHDYP
jgi:hypothetical protein